jgi:hypothetical protein
MADSCYRTQKTLMNFSRTYPIWSVVLATLMFSDSLAAQGKLGLKDWGNLAKVSPGVQVKIKLMENGKKLKGEVVSSDESGVSLMLSDGSRRTIAKTSIREIQASGKKRRFAPLVGSAAGAIALGAAASRPRFDLVGSAVALAAGVGAAIGFVLGMAFQYSIVYEAP